MTDSQVSRLRYFLIPGRPKLGSPSIEIHNLAFQFWMQHWTEVFKQNGVADKPRPDDFLRQDLISVVMCGDKVAALHLYSFFNLQLDAAKLHSYFQHSFTPKAMENIEKHRARHLMTLEYFSVAPEWQRKSQGVSLAVAIVCLGLRVFTRSGADMFLGVSRADVGVAKLGYEVGCLPLDTGVLLHGTPCDLQGCLRGSERFPRGEAENQLAERLWSQRLESPVSTNQSELVPETDQKIAA